MSVVVTDQINRLVSLNNVPRRIISTVPSQTELLFHLGLDEQIVGITRFCTHPSEMVKLKVKIGGTKQLDTDLIKQLKPDLIIANKEENDQMQINALIDGGIPVYISDPHNLSSALAMIMDVGMFVSKEHEAKDLASKIAIAFAGIRRLNPVLRVAYLIWRKPYMAAGQQTFINDMMQQCGMINVFHQHRYPEISADMLAEARPDVILLSSEPYPFQQKHLDEFQKISPCSMIKLVDGEMFSWYGNHLLKSCDYFYKIIGDLQADRSV